MGALLLFFDRYFFVTFAKELQSILPQYKIRLDNRFGNYHNFLTFKAR